jgi:hypothetical protein
MRTRWAEHVASMGEYKRAYKIIVGNLKECDQGVTADGRIILKRFLTEKDVRVWPRWLRIVIMGVLVSTEMNLRIP